MRQRPPAAGIGRRRGTLNRTTVDVRKVLTQFIEQNSTNAQTLFDRVAKKNPAKALELFAKLAEFVLPKLSRAEVLLPPAPPAWNHEPITAESAERAYLLMINGPATDLSGTFAPSVAVQADVQAAPPCEHQSVNGRGRHGDYRS